ncbi:MAG: hypothetical protein PHC40_03060 [Eubacteriales bacterium]|nr:hypothetical protein [Eubacteriales bacterium]
MNEMLFSTMNPKFILLLLAWGLLSTGALLFGIRFFARSNGKTLPILSGFAFCSLSFFFMLHFTMVTAPTERILESLKSASTITLVLSSVFFLSAAMFLFLRKPIGQSDFIYSGILDDIDDYVFVFDRHGQLVGQNHPRSKPPLLARDISAVDSLVHGTEIMISERYYLLSSSLMLDKKNQKIGSILLLHETTKQHQLINELSQKNEKADELNTYLLKEIEVKEELLLQQEFQRLSSSIHLELENKMNDVMKKITSMRTEDSIDQKIKIENLRIIAEKLRAMLADIRKIVYDNNLVEHIESPLKGKEQ